MSEADSQPEQPDDELNRKRRKRGILVAIALVGAILILPKIGRMVRPDIATPPYSAANALDPTLSVETFSSSRYRAAAKELVRRQLRDPASAVFSEIEVHPPRGNRSAVVCGMVAARNGYGGMNAAQRFIAGHQVILEAQAGPDLMDQAWLASCR